MPQTIITDAEFNDFITRAIYEDVHEGDHTSLACIPAQNRNRAKLLVKQEGVLAGVDLAKRIFKHLDPSASIEVFIEDGASVKYGDIAFIVESNTQALLKAERLVLNTMQRMSGTATLARKFSLAVEGTGVKILDTRKTSPLFRVMEKWAVRIGGCYNYRDGLYDRFMPKDNHVDACGSIEAAIERIHSYQKVNNLSLPITIEVRNLDELQQVLNKGGVDRIMLDNFKLPMMRKATQIINKRFEVEASGGVTLTRVRKIAETGVDFISVGALTHSAGTLDLSLKILK
jgi:nicotinate-nucleotide pyrophosphorylase (carboxylating)